LVDRRVVAEVVLKRDLLKELTGVSHDQYGRNRK